MRSLLTIVALVCIAGSANAACTGEMHQAEGLIVQSFLRQGDVARAAAAFEFLEARCDQRQVSPYVYQVPPMQPSWAQRPTVTCETRRSSHYDVDGRRTIETVCR